MASPAASLDHPDSQQDADFFGNFSTAPQPATRASAAPAHQAQHQQAAVDPFDLFGEGSTIAAPAAVAGHHASADDGLFGDVQGNQGQEPSCVEHVLAVYTVAHQLLVMCFNQPWMCVLGNCLFVTKASGLAGFLAYAAAHCSSNIPPQFALSCLPPIWYHSLAQSCQMSLHAAFSASYFCCV